ncbi:MAG: NAD(P)/FAD-dependent oxidoreductase [Kiritimatiellia bacterium]
MDASLLIIGAGPAGLLAALAAARRRLPHGVLVVDRMPLPGAKLAASGGGRGNLSHAATEEEFAAAFGRLGRFAIPAFRTLPPDALRARLAEIGIATVVDSGGRIYPRSQSAAQVRDALAAACVRAGVRLVYERAVQSLAPPETPEGPWTTDSFSAHAVLLAAGGQSAPRFGSDGSGFALARARGYDVVPPVPALTSLRTAETWPAAHSGLSLPDVTVAIAGKRGAAERGELLLTHRGISGPAVLNLSGRVARRLQDGEPVPIELDLAHGKPDFQALRQDAGARPILAWLARNLPRSLAGTILELAGIPADLSFSRLSAAQEKELARHLVALPLTVRGTGGFDDSMATAGGVSLKQIDPATLEGRLTPRLHFAGEILDLDGPTGGWNLQWAFCSGYLAGSTAGA